MCSDQVLSVSTSPDEVLAATAFLRNCGATTEFSSIVSIHRKSEGFLDKQDIVFIAKGRHQLSLDWSAARKLSIKCSTCSRAIVFRQVVVVGNIDVDYQLGSAVVSQK
jgi:hypothetical protein